MQNISGEVKGRPRSWSHGVFSRSFGFSQRSDTFQRRRSPASSRLMENSTAPSVSNILPNRQLSLIKRAPKRDFYPQPKVAVFKKVGWLASRLLKSRFVQSSQSIQSMVWTIGYYYSMSYSKLIGCPANELLHNLQPPRCRNIGNGPPAQWYLDWFGSVADRGKAVEACRIEYNKVLMEYMRSRENDCRGFREGSREWLTTLHSPESVVLWDNFTSNDYCDEEQDNNLVYGSLIAYFKVRNTINHMHSILKSQELTVPNLVALRRLIDRMLGCPQSLDEAKLKYRQLLARTSPDHNHALTQKGEFEKETIYSYFVTVKELKTLLDDPLFNEAIFKVPMNDLGLKPHHGNMEISGELKKIEFPIFIFSAAAIWIPCSFYFLGISPALTALGLVLACTVLEKNTKPEYRYTHLFNFRPPHNLLTKISKNYFHMIEFLGSKLPI